MGACYSCWAYAGRSERIMWRKKLKQANLCVVKSFFLLELAARRHGILMAPTVRPLERIFFVFLVEGAQRPANKFFGVSPRFFSESLSHSLGEGETFSFSRAKWGATKRMKQIFLKHKSVLGKEKKGKEKALREGKKKCRNFHKIRITADGAGRRALELELEHRFFTADG